MLCAQQAEHDLVGAARRATLRRGYRHARPPLRVREPPVRTPRALSLGFLKRESERSCALYLRDFAVFPTFPIRFGGSGAPLSREAVPPSPGPLTIDAERYLEMLAPLPIEGSVHVKSRVIGVHPRGTGVSAAAPFRTLKT